MGKGFAKYWALLTLLVNHSLTATVQCAAAGTSDRKHHCVQRPEDQTTDRIRYNSCVQLCTATIPKGEKLVLHADAGVVSSRENACQAFHCGTLKYFRRKKKS